MTNGRKVNGHHAQVNGKEESEFDEDEEAEDEYEDEGEYEEDEDEEEDEEDEDADGDEEEDEEKAARRANGRAGRKAAEEKPGGRDSLFNFGNSLAVTGALFPASTKFLLMRCPVWRRQHLDRGGRSAEERRTKVPGDDGAAR